MRPLIDTRIAKARSLESSGQAENAMLIAHSLVDEYPGNAKVWALRAHLYTLAGDYLKANSDITSAIDILPDDPYLFFRRGLNYLELRNWHAAISDFTRGLGFRDAAYESAFRFARAEAFIGLGRKHEALKDLAFVPEECTMWTYRLRSKAELVSECSE
jgi:tetratricopeptide (TPR) repeat protein